ncbi:hypothetical protein ACIOTI_32265 [Streptomyces sp. NPDC087843]|uniref:hypothetical protein n=1 Tax=Streptomyces sp. NPDC087843 TaxID=3365804 RepID=UPI00381F985D
MGNVVRHAAVLTAAATLAVEEQAALVLAIADAHPLKPKPLPAVNDLGGRGLLLVDALVREVHGRAEVSRRPPRAAISIRLPLAPVAA